MDLCTLEFCKLFGEKNGQHYWRKVITDQESFFSGLLAAIAMTAQEFDAYIKCMKFYRNKYVAHLDEEKGGQYPSLAAGKAATAYLFDYLAENENDDNYFPDVTQSSAEYYATRLAEGEAAYN
jgi:hypothetical protein